MGSDGGAGRARAGGKGSPPPASTDCLQINAVNGFFENVRCEHAQSGSVAGKRANRHWYGFGFVGVCFVVDQVDSQIN